MSALKLDYESMNLENVVYFEQITKKELDDLSGDYENSVTKRILLDTLEQLHIRQLSLV